MVKAGTTYHQNRCSLNEVRNWALRSRYYFKLTADIAGLIGHPNGQLIGDYDSNGYKVTFSRKTDGTGL